MLAGGRGGINRESSMDSFAFGDESKNARIVRSERFRKRRKKSPIPALEPTARRTTERGGERV
jgi:hypothetical protein